jgi:DNA polymerase III subunit beta
MKLQVTQENLSKALNNVARVATTRNTLPILSNILLKTVDNRLCVAATDLNIAITQFVGSKVSEKGSITVPARLTQDFISSLPPGPIELNLEDTKLKISTDQHKSTINGTSAEDYPVMPKIKNGQKWKANSETLKKALNQTVLAASNDDARPVLTGVNFHTENGELFIVATDSYRLAEKKIGKIENPVDVLVPASALQDLLRILDTTSEDVEITSDDQQILFKTGDAELVTRLIDGKFPDYKKLIPAKFATTAVIPRDELSNITKVSSLFARETGGSITLEISDENNEVSVKSHASQLGENSAKAKAKTKGSGQITLNSRFITDALGAIDADEVFIGFNQKLEPFIVKKTTEEDYKHIIMPLKS